MILADRNVLEIDMSVLCECVPIGKLKIGGIDFKIVRGAAVARIAVCILRRIGLGTFILARAYSWRSSILAALHEVW